MSTIVLDPGHGGLSRVDGSSPSNATGVGGTKEKDLTLEIGLDVARLLRQRGHTVLLTRETDINLALSARARVAATRKADAFLSIHFNAFEDTSVQGTEVQLHRAASARSRLLGKTVLRRTVEATGYRDRGLRTGQWGVLDPTVHDPATAACLVEVSFLTHPPEEERLRNFAYKRQIAQALADGVQDYLDGAVGFSRTLAAVESGVLKTLHLIQPSQTQRADRHE